MHYINFLFSTLTLKTYSASSAKVCKKKIKSFRGTKFFV